MYRLTWRSVMCLPDNQGPPRDRGGTLIETAQAAHLTGHPNCRQAAIVVVAADPAIANSIAGLPAQNAYLDGELCGVLPDGRTAFNLIQNATDTGEGSLIFFLYDLLFLDGENLSALPLVDRKARLASLLEDASASLRYNDHQIGHGPAFHRLACERGLEGIVSKRTNGRYEPDRRTWLKVKCLNREEFVVVGWLRAI